MSTEVVESTVSESTAEPGQPVRWVVAAVGALIAGLGTSGLIDDGLIEHPWWVAPVVMGIAAAIVVIVQTVRSLRTTRGAS